LMGGTPMLDPVRFSHLLLSLLMRLNINVEYACSTV
jgi:hypothetical protein